MSTKVEVSIDDLVAMWVDRNAEDVAPDAVQYSYYGDPGDTIEIEFFNPDEPEYGDNSIDDNSSM